MRVLIADDDPVSLRVLEATLRSWEFEVTTVRDGAEALACLEGENPPRLAIIDWMMPGMEGPEVCRRARSVERLRSAYFILLTGRGQKDDVVAGLEAGADDYVKKPFDREELRARVRVGVRVLGLQHELAHKVSDLQRALTHVKQLSGLLPICCYCKKIRDDQDYWMQVEEYIGERSSAEFTHGICPDCLERVLVE